MSDYMPHPIDTSNVDLPSEVDSLKERLAENTHDIWSLGRIKDGWSFGPKRDDDQKKHPCLVAYSELPESEKAYDRNTSMETLKAIYALGYRIIKE